MFAQTDDTNAARREYRAWLETQGLTYMAIAANEREIKRFSALQQIERKRELAFEAEANMVEDQFQQWLNDGQTGNTNLAQVNTSGQYFDENDPPWPY